MIARLERSPVSLRWLALAAALLLATGVWVIARQPDPAAAASHTVQATNFAFTPPTMSIAVGDTVTWTNGDAESHAVEGTGLTSPEIRPGGTFSQTFSEAGTISYFCRFHTYMTGTIRVGAAAPTTTAPPATAPPTTAPPTTAPPTTAPPSPTTTPPGSTPTTAPPATTPPPASGSGSSSSFQEVPDDPEGRQGPRADSFVAEAPPPTTAPPVTTPPPSPGFQEVPTDPAGVAPPGPTGARDSNIVNAPPSTSAPATTVPPSSPGFQDVPDDPSGGAPPGAAGPSPPTTAITPVTSHDDTPAPPPDTPDTTLAAAPVPDAGRPLGDGTVLAPFETDGGVKVFHLTLTETTIEVAPGDVRQAYAFNGVVPGPVLRVDEGDRVRIVVDNQLPFPTTTHWHGMILPNDQDGVGGITQPDIEPGTQYTYEWTAVATGTHWYHAHSSGRHIGKGLYGALEVVPRAGDLQSDRDYRLMLGDTDLGFTINGRSYPLTQELAAEVGETVRLRVINTGDQIHAFHLHGVPFEVAAQDGIVRRQPEQMDTLTIAPGQTYDLLFRQQYEGRWLIHCHMFIHSHESTDHHAEGENGMNGMVTVINVTPAGGSSTSELGDLLATSTYADRHSVVEDIATLLSLLTAIAGFVVLLRTRRHRSWPDLVPVVFSKGNRS